MGSGSGMKNPLASIHWSFSLKVRDDWGFQVNPLCRHDITSLFPPSGNEGYVCNRDVTCAHQSLSLFWISCDCFGTFMQLIIRVLSLRSRVIHGFVTEPWYSRHVRVSCELGSLVRRRLMYALCPVLSCPALHCLALSCLALSSLFFPLRGCFCLIYFLLLIKSPFPSAIGSLLSSIHPNPDTDCVHLPAVSYVTSCYCHFAQNVLYSYLCHSLTPQNI